MALHSLKSSCAAARRSVRTLTKEACEDYRAAATIDLEHDRESLSSDVKIGVKKLKVLWGASGMINKYDDPLQVWTDYSRAGVEVTGKAVQSGHYIPEHAPGEMLEQLKGFFA